MRPRNTLLLLLVLAALGAYVYWVDLPREKREAETKHLVDVDKTKISKVALDYPDRSIVIEKTGEHWRITKPIDADADDTALNNMVAAIATAEVTRTLEDVADKLPSYGLDKPVVTATLTASDGTAVPPIKIGKTTQVGYSSYVQKGDDPKVYITGAAFQAGMKKELKDLRDKSVIAFEDPEVQKIELTRPDQTIAVEREGDGDHWKITAPAPYRADDAEMRSLLASLRGVRATDFASDDPAADLSTYGLIAPRLGISVSLGKDRAQKTLRFGETQDKDGKKAVYAKRGESPTVYAIPEFSLKNLDKDLTTLRDKTVLAFDKEKAAKLTVTRKDGAGFVLAKRDGAWHVEGPGDGVERAPTVTRFLDDLAGLKGNEIVAEHGVDFGRFGLTAPDLTVGVEDASGAALGTLIGSIGTGGPSAGADATSYVAAQGTDVVYGVKPFVYTRLDKKVADFRERPATPLPSGAGIATPAAPSAGLGAAGDEQAGDEDTGDQEDPGDGEP